MEINKYRDIDGQILKLEINECGTKRYRNSNNQYHRLDGPAIEYSDGGLEWYKEGKYHRIGGPDCYFPIETYFWHLNGKRIDIYYICG